MKFINISTNTFTIATTAIPNPPSSLKHFKRVDGSLERRRLFLGPLVLSTRRLSAKGEGPSGVLFFTTSAARQKLLVVSSRRTVSQILCVFSIWSCKSGRTLPWFVEVVWYPTVLGPHLRSKGMEPESIFLVTYFRETFFP